jgi:hypothetical protein
VQIVAFTNGTSTAYALFHIGGANGGNPANCTADGNGARPAGRAMSVEEWHADRVSKRKHAMMRGREAGAAVPAAPVASSLHVSTSVYGPWTPVQPQPPNCNNPAPLFHPNGTWFLLCDSSTLFSAPALTGPWTQLRSIPTGGIDGSYEDANLYIDERGNWCVAQWEVGGGGSAGVPEREGGRLWHARTLLHTSDPHPCRAPQLPLLEVLRHSTTPSADARHVHTPHMTT